MMLEERNVSEKLDEGGLGRKCIAAKDKEAGRRKVYLIFNYNALSIRRPFDLPICNIVLQLCDWLVPFPANCGFEPTSLRLLWIKASSAGPAVQYRQICPNAAQLLCQFFTTHKAGRMRISCTILGLHPYHASLQ